MCRFCPVYLYFVCVGFVQGIVLVLLEGVGARALIFYSFKNPEGKRSSCARFMFGFMCVSYRGLFALFRVYLEGRWAGKQNLFFRFFIIYTTSDSFLPHQYGPAR